MSEIILVYILLGAFAGIAAGMLGVGGGLIIVPVLVYMFRLQGFSDTIIVHLAVGTSLLTIVFTSLSSVYAHHQHRAVQWKTFLQLTPGIILGALTGALIADHLKTEALRIFFGIFELYVAIQLSLNIKPKSHRQLPGRAGLSGAGVIIGTVSSLLGIGGGTLTVPYLVWNNINIRHAVATSAACGLPIALGGSIGFMYFGWYKSVLPQYSAGYVYCPAVLAIVAASVLFAPLGAMVAHRVRAETLKRIFSILLYILAFNMIFGQ